MGLERRLSRASPTMAASLDSVLTVSSVDFRPEDKAQAAAAHISPSSREVKEEEGSNTDTTSSSMPPPPPPLTTATTSETFDACSIRSTSPTSRNANRLSLTLPIARPDSLPSRPTPTSSMPPTPIDTLTFHSPVDSDHFIVAIAAQERRVLELRDELTRAEAELKKLQRQWTISEACKKRPPNTTAEPLRALAPAASLRDSSEDNPVAKRSSELERRKAILLAQSQGTPPRHKRTVFRGSHTRALSLLSPTNSVGDASIHDDSVRSPDSSYISPPPSSSSIRHAANKRATWAPYQSTQPSTGVKQLANDFKQGLWTFVEDLRQATVGDEAISGTTNRTTEMGSRSNKAEGDQDTIRASATNRGRIPFTTELDSLSDRPSTSSTSSSGDRAQHRRTTSRPELRARKHFSWTPLTFDNFDDDDWSNWDTPNVKTSRWSGSTVNGDVVPAIPERADENETALKHKGSKGERPASSRKTSGTLEELPQAILNRLTPSKIKSTTSNFIKEWEKSLSPPQTATFDAGFQDFMRDRQ
ncbi:hypothetical protein F4860DRAFT_483387 [Xylaria cubensis]|nr:hypothetical protein F4860DRAFT_483387 [Xylaria cubensis]